MRAGGASCTEVLTRATVARSGLVKRTVAAKIRQYPELRSPTFDGFMRVAQREDIDVIRMKFSRVGMTGFARRPFIVLDEQLAGDELLEIALHELGHVYLHLLDTKVKKAERTHKGRCELEANLFAAFILGPGRFVPQPYPFPPDPAGKMRNQSSTGSMT